MSSPFTIHEQNEELAKRLSTALYFPATVSIMTKPLNFIDEIIKKSFFWLIYIMTALHCIQK